MSTLDEFDALRESWKHREGISPTPRSSGYIEESWKQLARKLGKDEGFAHSTTSSWDHLFTPDQRGFIGSFLDELLRP
jgi:hypothetical protein